MNYLLSVRFRSIGPQTPILSQHQDAGRHLNWAVVGNHIALREN